MLKCKDLFCKKVKEAFPLHRGYPYNALGGIDAQSRSLAACNNKCCNLARAQKLPAAADVYKSFL